MCCKWVRAPKKVEGGTIFKVKAELKREREVLRTIVDCPHMVPSTKKEGK